MHHHSSEFVLAAESATLLHLILPFPIEIQRLLSSPLCQPTSLVSRPRGIYLVDAR